ncbi:MAG: HEAT repeat domain-containing protein [Anaerolineales bacterium]|nr:HEAT repeat domain-containing protein [Anaerolineales bacterium]
MVPTNRKPSKQEYRDKDSIYLEDLSEGQHSVRKLRYPLECELLLRAAHGDEEAAIKVLGYLKSQNPDLRKIILSALHDCQDALVWQCLINYLANQEWSDPLDSISASPSPEPAMVERLHQTIVEAFITNEDELEKELKDRILSQALTLPGPPDSPSGRVRLAAGYLLGLLGDHRAIPVLEEILTFPVARPPSQQEEYWQLQAIHALTVIHTSQCGPPLLKVLAGSRGQLHQEAGKALMELGNTVEDTWLVALTYPDSHVRWHAARGLGQIGDTRALSTLASGLYDEKQEVRWASARLLAQMDVTAIPAVLHVISHYPINEPFRQAAYHALHAMPSHQAQKYLEPLLQALHSSSASLAAPLQAQKMAAEWQGKNLDPDQEESHHE